MEAHPSVPKPPGFGKPEIAFYPADLGELAAAREFSAARR
jgi:hypothetical protein